MTAPSSRSGLLAGLASYVLWGSLPFYWHYLGSIGPIEILAQRVFWSAVSVGLIVLVWRKVPDVRRVLRSPRDLGIMALAAVLIAVNWGVFIWAVNSGHAIDASLGYFMMPLAAVAIGVVVLKERLRAVQWVALALAAGALVVLGIAAGSFPWIACVLAGSFSLYSLVKKATPLPPLTGMMTETLVLAPVALLVLALLAGHGDLRSTHHGPLTVVLVLLSGFVTAIPLLLFAVAAKSVPLSTLGILQYINPVLQMAIGYFAFHEPLPLPRLIGFALVWLALILFSIDVLSHYHREARVAGETTVTGVHPGEAVDPP